MMGGGELKSATKLAKGQYLKVYLYRGFIGLPKCVRENAKCLGLTKRFQTVYIPPAKAAIGNLLKIKQLVKVELVQEKPKPRLEPLYPKGYRVIGSYLSSNAKFPNLSIL